MDMTNIDSKWKTEDASAPGNFSLGHSGISGPSAAGSFSFNLTLMVEELEELKKQLALLKTQLALLKTKLEQKTLQEADQDMRDFMV